MEYTKKLHDLHKSYFKFQQEGGPADFGAYLMLSKLGKQTKPIELQEPIVKSQEPSITLDNYAQLMEKSKRF